MDDDENTDLSHESPIFALPYTGTYSWTWPAASQYADQPNIFYHTNKVARWYESRLHNITFKVDLVANTDTPGASAWMIGGTVPLIEYSDAYDSERQADVVYHEYTHAVVYKLHGSSIGSDGEGGALSEAVAFYFSASLIGDHWQYTTNSSRPLDNTKKYTVHYSDNNTNHDNGMIPAGACWHLREELGAAKADSIIFAALEMDSPRADTFEEFTDNVLLSDDDIYGNGYWSWESCDHGWGDTSPHAGEIWYTFNELHEMPTSLLDEDPDCPSSKPTAQPTASTLEGAYPNPFNSSVNLRYQITEPAQVDIGVYSLTGQLVRNLPSHHVPRPGTYSVSWNGMSDAGVPAASGIYFIRVSHPDQVKSFKLSLLK